MMALMVKKFRQDLPVVRRLGTQPSQSSHLASGRFE